MESSLLVFSLGFISLGFALPWKDCGSTQAVIQTLFLSGCTESDSSCPLKRGTNETLTMTFKTKTNIKILKAEVSGIISGVTVPFPLSNEDACTGSGLVCPLPVGKIATYTVQLPILKLYPSIRVVVKWSLLNSNNETVTCFVLPAEIISGNS